MKKILRSLVYFFLIAFSLQSCDDKDDVDKETYNATTALEIKDFIWRGLNDVYLWQADVPNLADNRFANQEDFDAFLKGYSEPEDLFQDLLNKPKSKYPIGAAIDRFSWIVDDYTVLEQELSGITKNSGIDFGLSYIEEGSENVVGYIRYIIPNSDASKKDIKRGDLFTKVNGTQLTASNYKKLLLDSDSYTLSLAVISNNSLVLTGKSVKLTKTILEENPILINKIISSGSHKIGYLMYNGFYNEYDNALNQAFAELKSGGVTDLVLDLRYNGGGVVHSSTLLASMITGQFKGQVFSQRQYNPKQMALMNDEDLESLKERFTDKTNSGTALNSLNLNTVYIITTEDTASASELVINGLRPYINIVQIGGTTLGKNVGSNTIYDSPSLLSKAQINPTHKYAMQPLTFKITNADNFGDYTSGLTPNFTLEEKVSTYGVLGDPSEPLLNLAISKITGSTAKRIQADKGPNLPYFTDSKSMRRFGKEMYIKN